MCVIVALSCLTLCNPTDCSLPGSLVHGILQARILEWIVNSLLQRIFPTQRSNLGLLHCRQILYRLGHQGSPNYLYKNLIFQMEVAGGGPSKQVLWKLVF